MKIYLDIDEVICDFCLGLESIYPEYKKVNQLTYALPEYVNLSLLTDKEEFWANLCVLDRPTFPVTGYISHRLFSPSITEEWLIKNGMPIGDIYHVNNSNDKIQLLIGLRADYYVDDKPETFLLCEQAGINCYLYSQPWNYHIKTNKRINQLEELNGKIANFTKR